MIGMTMEEVRYFCSLLVPGGIAAGKYVAVHHDGNCHSSYSAVLIYHLFTNDRHLTKSQQQQQRLHHQQRLSAAHAEQPRETDAQKTARLHLQASAQLLPMHTAA